MKNNKFIVYADINCPFCFALHERLTEMDYIDAVDWRMIEHAPQIKYDTNDLKIQAELSEEIRRLRDLASEIAVIVPDGRPNSRAAIRLIKACEKIDSEKARYLRTSIYRALWREGLDISDPEILNEISHKVGLNPDELDLESIEELKHWQQEWETGDFSRNIPVLVTDSENKLLGLPSPQIIEAFLSGEEKHADFYEGAFCYLKPKEKVLIVAEKDELLDCFADALEKDYQIEFAQNGQYVIETCRADSPPDLVLMDINMQDLDGFATCLEVKDHEKSQNISIILFGSEKSVDDEVKAFDSGAADYITLPCAREVILARVRVQLRLKRTTDLLEQYSRLDGLTEVPNRREFERVFEKEWRRSIRSRIPLSIILVDVDFFKPFNDNYGHMEGDHCLKLVAQTLEQGIYRAHDTVARYGGEEFVIILPDTEFEGACAAAEKFRLAIEQLQVPHAYSNVSDFVTISSGVATTIPNRQTTSTQLIDIADTALYAAKSAGRNCVRANMLDSDKS